MHAAIPTNASTVSQPLSLIFAGTPEFSVPALEALIASRHRVLAVYTQPDRPAGRGQQVTMSAVKQCALRHELPVEQPLTLKDATAVERLAQWQADLMVVVAYGLLLPKNVLETPRLGCVNIHASLLPRWRGAAPIQRAIQAGDKETGVTIMQMDEGLDTGAVIRQNIGFSLLTKLVALVLAAFGFVNLWIAVAADMGTSLAVTSNGMRLAMRRRGN